MKLDHLFLVLSINDCLVEVERHGNSKPYAQGIYHVIEPSEKREASRLFLKIERYAKKLIKDRK